MEAGLWGLKETAGRNGGWEQANATGLCGEKGVGEGRPMGPTGVSGEK